MKTLSESTAASSAAPTGTSSPWQHGVLLFVATSTLAQLAVWAWV